jgi:hypothetical protein
VQYLLSCVCLNTFTGRELTSRYWADGKALPALTPAR